MKRELSRGLYFIYDSCNYLSHRNLASEDFETVLNAADSPSKMGGLSDVRCRYVKDPENYWMTPNEFFDNNLHGDCEDFSRFFYLCALKNKIKSNLLVTWSNENGHAICLFPELGMTVCNFGRINHFTKDVSGIVTYWYEDWLGYNLYEMNPVDYSLKRVTSEVRNTVPDTKSSNGNNLASFIKKMKSCDALFEKTVNESIAHVKSLRHY